MQDEGAGEEGRAQGATKYMESRGGKKKWLK
jgi:hypothetical protein